MSGLTSSLNDASLLHSSLDVMDLYALNQNHQQAQKNLPGYTGFAFFRRVFSPVFKLIGDCGATIALYEILCPHFGQPSLIDYLPEGVRWIKTNTNPTEIIQRILSFLENSETLDFMKQEVKVNYLATAGVVITTFAFLASNYLRPHPYNEYDRHKIITYQLILDFMNKINAKDSAKDSLTAFQTYSKTHAIGTYLLNEKDFLKALSKLTEKSASL